MTMTLWPQSHVRCEKGLCFRADVGNDMQDDQGRRSSRDDDHFLVDICRCCQKKCFMEEFPLVGERVRNEPRYLMAWLINQRPSPLKRGFFAIFMFKNNCLQIKYYFNPIKITRFSCSGGSSTDAAARIDLSKLCSRDAGWIASARA